MTDNTFESFGKMVYDLMQHGMDTEVRDVYEDFRRARIEATSRFKKGDTAFVFFADGPSICKCEVLEFNDREDGIYLHLHESTGRNLGWWMEDCVYHSRAELIKYYRDYFDKAEKDK